ncbi:MAG: hypothetical protein ACJ76Z_13635 [Thermoleophilaceae bacterium]
MQLRTFPVIAVLVLGLPAPALASSADVIRDCAQDGHLDKHYSQKELRQAERNLPSDIDEYTDCRQAIRNAMAGGSGAGGAPPNGIVTPSGAIAGSPADIQALQKLTADAAKGKRPEVVIGGHRLLPGNAGLGGVLGGLAGANGMPAPLLLAIAALALLAVVTAYLAAREKVPLVRRVALRIFSR